MAQINLWFKYVKPMAFVSLLLLSLLVLAQKYRFDVSAGLVGCLPIRLVLLDKRDQSVERGNIVSFLSSSAEPYYANGVKFTKIAVAVAGDRVVVTKGAVMVTTPSGEKVTYETDASRMLSYAQIPLADIEREWVIPKGKIFALGTLPASFDSRYWGLLDLDRVIGVGYAIF
ncbi:S26 family signal peptidase [Vibrio owensii]|uniref:S26 family signal peptidase n=1 Tax=Vibrio owensii TaxID=696485 RepID=UPI00406855D2